MLVQAFFKEFLSKIPGLQEVEHSFLNFDVDESIRGDFVNKVVQ